MTLSHAKQPFPVEEVRRYLEPGPVVLVSSRAAGAVNVMTMGWHLVMEFSPSLVGCIIAAGNHSHGLIRQSRECVINLPTVDLADTVASIGNCTGAEVDKFERFGLTAEPGRKVGAPLIGECHASFECRLHDDAMADAYGFFVFEVVAAHVRPSPVHPPTLHYTGGGVFMTAGKTISRKALFTKVS